MKGRILPRNEWPNLDGTEAADVWPHLPLSTQVFVVEDDAKIIGTWLLVQLPHAECLWIDPAYRHRSSVGRHLLKGMRMLAKCLGVSNVITGAMTDDVRDMILSVGGHRLPGDHYVLPVEAK